MKLNVLTVFVLLFNIVTAQSIDNNSLLGVPRLSTNDRLNNITGTIQEGNLVYDTDIHRLFEYTNTGWQEILTAGNIYPGVFTITGPGIAKVTGIPFRPSSVTFVAHINIESLDFEDDNSTGNNNNNGPNNSFGTMNGFARDDGGLLPVQQVIYLGASANSINDISRLASNTNAIGARYGNQNGDNLGIIRGQVTEFTNDGFIINMVYTNGTVNIQGEDLVVLFTAYR